MDKDEYDKVERPALEQLQQLGWHFLPGAQLAPPAACTFTDDPNAERSSFRDVVLDKRLTARVQRINPWISDENFRKVVREITHPHHATLMGALQGFPQKGA